MAERRFHILMKILAFQQCKYARISPRATLHLQSPIRSSQYQITRLTFKFKIVLVLDR